MSDLYYFKKAVKALSPEFIDLKEGGLLYSDHETIRDVFELLMVSPIIYKDAFISMFFNDFTIGNKEYKEVKDALKKLKSYHFKKKLLSGFLKYLIICSRQHLNGYAIEASSLRNAVKKYLFLQGLSSEEIELLVQGKRKEFVIKIQEKKFKRFKKVS